MMAENTSTLLRRSSGALESAFQATLSAEVWPKVIRVTEPSSSTTGTTLLYSRLGIFTQEEISQQSSIKSTSTPTGELTTTTNSTPSSSQQTIDIDNLTPLDISLASYNYLSQNVVGDEYYVNIIRMMNAVRENLTRDDTCATITSGSFGEGLGVRGSDLDILFILKNFEVSEDEIFYFKFSKTCFKSETEEVHPGYTRLRLMYTSDKKHLELCEKLYTKYYFSNALFKEWLLEFQVNTNLKSTHGPALWNKINDIDVVYCLHTASWILSAKNWITRSNSLWPSRHLKRKIVNHGVLFVPVGFKDSPKEDLEWRISFNVGERLLIYSFTHTQLICYCLMKILLNDVINRCLDLKYRELLCSYFVKTILFWVSEELPPSIWKPENLMLCFIGCFRRLIYCVQYSVCPHYFVPENNMFENRIVGRAREVLLDKLVTLERYGWRCIIFSGKLGNKPGREFFWTPSWSFKNSQLMIADIISVAALSPDYFNLSQTDKIGIRQILSLKTPKIKYAYKFYMSMIYTHKAQLIPLTDEFGSKYYYMNYKACQCCILQNIYHDDVTGWLILASFFYRTKQYSKAIYVLSKYVYIRLYPTVDMGKTYRELIHVKSFRKRFFPLLKVVRSEAVIFPLKSTLIPPELQMEVEKTQLVLPPTTFTQFLSFLCHYRLNNFSKRVESLRELQKTIEKPDRISELTAKALSYICLGIAFHLHGDKDSARLAFLQAYELESCGVKEVALKRLRWLELLQHYSFNVK